MYKIYNLIFLFLLCSGSIFAQQDTRAESVEYDPVNNRFLASIGASASIVQIDTAGNSSLFGNSLLADLGMEIIGNYLFAITPGADSYDPAVLIKGFDLTTEQEVMSYTVANAIGLNGMGSDGVSKLWVTDFFSPSIYEIDVSDISNPQSQLVVSLTETPNGITYDESNNRLIFVSWSDDKIRALDLSDNSVSIVLDHSDISNMDGIDMDDNDNFYVSSWNPDSRITKYSNDFSTSEIIMVPNITNPADICVAREINMLAIPSFQHDVILWSLGDDMTSSSSNFQLLEKETIHVFPNPSNGISHFKINNLDWSKLQYSIFDKNGKMMKQFTFENSGAEKYLLNLSNEISGNYIVNFIIDDKYIYSNNFMLVGE